MRLVHLDSKLDEACQDSLAVNGKYRQKNEYAGSIWCHRTEIITLNDKKRVCGRVEKDVMEMPGLLSGQ